MEIKQFVSYEIAKELLELGFDEPCLGTIEYSEGGRTFNLQTSFKTNSECYPGTVAIPLWQEAIDWFREKHNIHLFIDIYPTEEEPNRCWYMVRNLTRKNDSENDYMSGWFDNQYKAREKGVLKLIQLINDK
jgi:hypothetical protein